ncbi:MAG: Gfo/Idh/MocA family oxidoreductase [Pontixanthobacter sp.]
MRWGIIGFGWVARDFVAPAMLAEGHRIAAIADPSIDAQTAGKALGARVFPAYADMLADGGFDAVYIATPNHLHAEACIAALEAGIPVLCEKPMAASLTDAERMADAVRRTGTLYGTAFDQRHHPAHRRLTDTILAGTIGRVVAMRLVYACWVDPHFAPNADHDNWRIAPDKAGGGAVIDLALHGLDLTQMLVGERFDTLSIMLQRRLHDYAVDDGGMLTARTPSGILLNAHTAYNCAETLPRRRLEILGETGLLTATDTMGQTAGGTLTLQEADSAPRAVPFDDVRSPFAAQIAAFADATNGQVHDFDVDRDLALMRLFDAAHEEARRCL